MNIMRVLAALAVVWVALGSTTASAQTFELGQMVEGCGFKGKIVEIKPRPGWDVPFYVIRYHSRTTHYDINCTPEQMRAVAEPAPAASPANRRQNPAPTEPEPMIDPAVGRLCKPGSKLEGRWGNSWYAVTVRAAPDADGKCPVSFDGFGRMWDTAMTMDSIRPRGSGYVYKPKSPVAREPAGTVAHAGAMRDGRYTCHKIYLAASFSTSVI